MVKIHARVTKEIEITEEQAERLINNLCGSVEHSNIDDIIEKFTEDIDAGNYEKGYIPLSWMEVDLISQKEKLTKESYEYLKEEQKSPCYTGVGIELS